MCNVVINDQLKGVELYFEGKPEEEVRNLLKTNGFRYHKVKVCWYAKQNEKTLKLAEEMSEEKKEVKTETKEAKNNIKSNKKEESNNTDYFPSYNKLGDADILRSSDIELNKITGYFFDIKAYIHFYNDSALIVDLSNALKTGKECKRYSISLKERWDSTKSVITELWNKGKLETVKGFYEAVIAGLNIDTLHVEEGEEKGINTFSPFVEVKPIKIPSKWTISHVWKAILSGQIFKGVKDGHYTDDYAYDAASNFGTGCGIHLISFAEKIIESSSGWWVSVDKEENGITQLSVNCHSFDLNTLYFDVNCNLEEAENRKQQETNSREEYNNNMLAKVKPIIENDVDNNTLYNVEYIEIDDNTDIYVIRTKMLKGSSLFYEGEINYQIINIEEYPIEDNIVYTISDFYNRPYFEDDQRFIDMGNWETVITGKALRETLREGHNFPTIKQSQYKTFDKTLNQIQMFISGKTSWGFSSQDTNYQESFNRLMKEINRI